MQTIREVYPGTILEKFFGDKTFIPPQMGPSLRLCVAEAAGAEENAAGKPLVGGSGRIWDSLLSKAGIKRSTLSIINTLPFQPPDNLYPTDPAARIYCTAREADEIVNFSYEQYVKPVLHARPWSRIDAIGNKSLRLLTGKTEGIMKWRGSPLPLIGEKQPRVIGILHPSYLMRDSAMIPATISDLIKGTQVPPQFYTLEPTLEDVREFAKSRTLVFDIETNGFTGQITMVGLCDPSKMYHVTVVPFRGAYIEALKYVFAETEYLVGQNCISFDIPVMEQAGIVFNPKAEVFDIMLMHHLMHPDEPHDLEFIASIYTQMVAWKHLASEDMAFYNACDVDATAQIYLQLRPLLARFKLMDLYQKVQVPLAKICKQMHDTGIRIDPNRIHVAREKLLVEFHELEAKLPEELKPYDKSIRIRKPAPAGTLGKSGKPIKFVHIAGTERVVPWQSPKKCEHWLYETLKLPPQIHPKTKKITSSKSALERLAKKFNMPELDALRKLRSLDELLTTFLKEDESARQPVTRIHSNFLVHGTSTGRLSSSGPNCFSGDTEVLTPNGWARFDSLDKNLEVMQWDNGILSFTKPTDYFISEDECIHISNEHIDLCVTKNHRCPVETRAGLLEVRRADDYIFDRKQYNAGLFRSNNKAYWSDDELILICAIQADGHWKKYSVDFVFGKQRKIERLIGCLHRLGIEFTLSSKGKYSRIRLRNSHRLAYYKGLLGGDGKHFGKWLLTLPSTQMDFICEEVMRWDGCITRMNHYSSNEEINVDWIQTLFVIRGKRANKRIYHGSKHLNYQVDVTHSDHSWTTNVIMDNAGKQMVYCISVPSTFILVRRNGKTMISGNCQNIPPKARYIYVPSFSDWCFVEADFSSLENRLAAWYANDSERLTRLSDPNFNEHRWLASKIYNIPESELTKEMWQYKNGKITNHGADGAMGPRKLALTHALPEKVARELILKWREINWKSAQWQETIGNEAVGKGVLTNAFSRKRWFWSKSGYTEGIRFLPQSTGADICFRTMIGLCYKSIGWPEDLAREVCPVLASLPYPARLVLQVHDSLLIECPLTSREEVVDCIRKVGTQSWHELAGFSIPIDVKVGEENEGWGELHHI